MALDFDTRPLWLVEFQKDVPVDFSTLKVALNDMKSMNPMPIIRLITVLDESHCSLSFNLRGAKRPEYADCMCQLTLARDMVKFFKAACMTKVYGEVQVEVNNDWNKGLCDAVNRCRAERIYLGFKKNVTRNVSITVKAFSLNCPSCGLVVMQGDKKINIESKIGKSYCLDLDKSFLPNQFKLTPHSHQDESTADNDGCFESLTDEDFQTSQYDNSSEEIKHVKLLIQQLEQRLAQLHMAAQEARDAAMHVETRKDISESKTMMKKRNALKKAEVAAFAAAATEALIEKTLKRCTESRKSSHFQKIPTRSC